MFGGLKSIGSVVAGIMVAGAILDIAGSGKLGTAAQNMALMVTRGYGVSATGK